MIIKLASSDIALLNADIQKILVGWTPGSEPAPGFSLIKLPPAILSPATFDSNGTIMSEAVLSTEIRYDIVVPEDYTVPGLSTRVHPNISDHELYI